MNIKLMKSPKVGNSLLVVFTCSDKIKPENVPFSNQFEINGSKEFLKELKDSGEISGKKGEMTLLHSLLIENFTFNSGHLGEKLNPKRILFVGLGDSKKVDSEKLRNSSAQIAKKVESLVSFKNFTGIIHLGSSRKSVYEYAKSLGANVQEASISNLSLKVPEDTSLNCELYDNQLSIYEDNETI